MAFHARKSTVPSATFQQGEKVLKITAAEINGTIFQQSDLKTVLNNKELLLRHKNNSKFLRNCWSVMFFSIAACILMQKLGTNLIYQVAEYIYEGPFKFNYTQLVLNQDFASFPFLWWLFEPPGYQTCSKTVQKWRIMQFWSVCMTFLKNTVLKIV